MENIPEINSLDSMEGIVLADIRSKDQNKLEIKKEIIEDFIAGFRQLKDQDDFGLYSRFGEASFSHLGYPELGNRWALAYFKKQMDVVSENMEVSHYLTPAYEIFENVEKIDSELKRNLGEMLGKLYESAGRFSWAYKFYRESCPDKYADKLSSVKLSSEISDGIPEEYQWQLQIPSDKQVSAFPNFRVTPPEERDSNQRKLFEDFLKLVPEEVMQIDTKKEYKLLMEEARKIVEKYL